MDDLFEGMSLPPEAFVPNGAAIERANIDALFGKKPTPFSDWLERGEAWRVENGYGIAMDTWVDVKAKPVCAVCLVASAVLAELGSSFAPSDLRYWQVEAYQNHIADAFFDSGVPSVTLPLPLQAMPNNAMEVKGVFDLLIWVTDAFDKNVFTVTEIIQELRKVGL